MREYDGGYILPHLLEYLKYVDGKFVHGKLGGMLDSISNEEAARMVMYNFHEENAWNIEGISVISEHPKTPSEIAMNHFAEEVGIDTLEEALKWCQDISYRVMKEKKELFESLSEKAIVAGNRMRWMLRKGNPFFFLWNRLPILLALNACLFKRVVI